MQGYVKIAVAVVAGFVVGMFVNAPLRGATAQNANPLEGRLSHISFAVADVEETTGAFTDVFGVEMSDSQDFRDIPWGPRFPGKLMNTRRIGLNINGVSFEFLQPLEGESPWREFIDRSGDGVHHIGFSVPDVAAARAYLESKGGVQAQAYSEAANYVDMTDGGLPITFEVTLLPQQQQ